MTSGPRGKSPRGTTSKELQRVFIAPFRRLDWNQTIRSEGEVTETRDRLGKEIRAQVAGTADLPEDLIVLTPVYRQLGEQELHQVRCRIDLHPLDQRIELSPFPGEIDAAYERQQGSIAQRLREGLGEDTRIYYGTP